MAHLDGASIGTENGWMAQAVWFIGIVYTRRRKQEAQLDEFTCPSLLPSWQSPSTLSRVRSSSGHRF